MMTRIAWALGKIPGIPSKRKRGEKKVRKRLTKLRGDADLIAIVRGNDGWEFIPANMHDEGDEQWVEPVDPFESSFPADGIPDTPPTLFGVPVSIGYKDFGCLNEVPNTRFEENQLTLGDLLGTETVGDGQLSKEDEDIEDEEFKPQLGPMHERLNWWDRYQLDKGLLWAQGSSETMVLGQDGDAKLSAERADYQMSGDGPEWFETRVANYRYDARGHGAPPQPLQSAQLALAYAPFLKLVAPVLCRIARNMHSGRLVETTSEQEIKVTPGGRDARSVRADGGTELRRGDIIVEERAMIWPADIKLLGGSSETQDGLETLQRQVIAKENTAGSEWAGKAVRIGAVLLAAMIGAVIGDVGFIVEVLS